MFVSSTYSITVLHYTYGWATCSAADVNYRYNQHIELLAYTTIMGAPPYAQPLLVTSTRTITALHYTYGCATLSAAYLCKIYLENHWVNLHLWVSNVKCSLCWLGLFSESMGYTSLMGVQP